MFNVIDQFGMLWDVLGYGQKSEDINRITQRIEYEGDNPIFLISYSHGDESNIKRRLSIIADARELKEVIRAYTFVTKAAIDSVFIVLPDRITKNGIWRTELLKRACLLMSHETPDYGYFYETDNGSYIDMPPNDKNVFASYEFYSQALQS
ncbi:hypothetical protein [Pseudomonas arsenicoxydans]|uniref:Uncharacterized protein n=1 Tax=Pseudomonas arsenicoxydans TaxID=702115 RepID=A0A502HMA9_9PSED|nr:hypothetical protein [Pseudomonas arsenicoxydans]TPG75887.1 hypothetical protein EAH78_20375 [Pseudomonas arsenicoxydans]